ncbi:MAG: hypothetical protein NC416_08915 [Eubacterium sp.]|nr:hypothetical protein [Eubacterium sp.]
MGTGKHGEMMLKTTAEQFIDQAAKVTDKISAVAEALDELEEVVLRTSHYWIGEAGDHYRILYGENREEIEEMMKGLSAHPAQLLKMAQLTAKDMPGGELSKPLPADVL